MRRPLPSRAPLRSFLNRVARWRDSLHYHWFTLDKGSLAVAVVLGLLVCLMGSFGYFAYSQHTNAELERQRRADLDCLARNVYHEARGEPSAGQHAVAEVTLNRVASPRFPDTVCEVVYEKRWDRRRRRHVGAFSWTELTVRQYLRGSAWERVKDAARSVYDAEREPLVGESLFYHAVDIEPSWATSKKRITVIGRHVFYGES